MASTNGFIRALIVLLFGLASFSARGEEPSELATLRQQFETQVTAIRRETAEKTAVVKKTCLDALDTVQRQIAASGDLDRALIVKGERDRIDSGAPLSGSQRDALPPAVQKELSAYEKALAPLVQARDTAEAKATTQYLTALADLQKQFTQANELEKAVAVRAEREKREPAAAALAATASASEAKAAAFPTITGANLTRRIVIKAFVDATDEFIIQDGKLFIHHIDWTRPTNISINGKKWEPAWTDQNDTEAFTKFANPLAPFPGRKIRLELKEGLGKAEILELPTPENGQKLVVRLQDSGSGASNFEAEILW
jgi:hypothetical protein